MRPKARRTNVGGFSSGSALPTEERNFPVVGVGASAGRRGSRLADRAEAEAWSVTAARPSHPRNRPMHQRRPGLARGRVQPAARPGQAFPCTPHPPSAGYAPMEARGLAQMRSCRKGRYAPPVHMVKLTETRSATRYKWVHPDEEG